MYVSWSTGEGELRHSAGLKVLQGRLKRASLAMHRILPVRFGEVIHEKEQGSSLDPIVRRVAPGIAVMPLQWGIDPLASLAGKLTAK